MNKYNARKTTMWGITFDSRKEAERYAELKLMERAGCISNLRRQVKFELIPAQRETFPRYNKYGDRLQDGSRCVERECAYVADFVYNLPSGEQVVEDAKGLRTDAYKIKRKLMLYVHGIKVKES